MEDVLCSRESYNALTNWLTDARTMASPDIVIVLVGNKKDLEASHDGCRALWIACAERLPLTGGSRSDVSGSLALCTRKRYGLNFSYVPDEPVP
jgi:hypothetical protein